MGPPSLGEGLGFAKGRRGSKRGGDIEGGLSSFLGGPEPSDRVNQGGLGVSEQHQGERSPHTGICPGRGELGGNKSQRVRLGVPQDFRGVLTLPAPVNRGVLG